MRNLKRALSLALATVMTMGLMMVGTGASYKDVKTSHNVEAIEVLQTVGIMTGDENGNFNPDKSVTRNEMAVVMSNLLKLDYNYYRGTNPFADVPSWAAPYVAACAAEGIVSGVGGNLYNGEGNVTAAQASLMIMKALGYFQYQADFGDDWQIATIRQASQINLLDGINAKAEDALTRNQIAQLVLNGLKAKMVSFTGDVGTEATIGGATINIGYRAEYTPKTNAAQKYNSIDLGTTNIAENDQYYVQLGEELYNGDLELHNSTDVFGRPARYWEYDGKEIGTYAKYDLMVKEYTTKVTGKDLYDLLTSNTVDTYKFNVTIDGVSDYDINNAVFDETSINRNNKAGVGATGNGTLTQVFVDSTAKRVDIAVINTYLAIADDDYDEKQDEVGLDVYGIEAVKKDTYVKQTATDSDENLTVSGEDFDIADVKDGDLFLVTVADGAIQTMAEPETLAGVEITSFKQGSNLTVDGTKYDYASTLSYDYESLEAYTNGTIVNLKDMTYNVYLDQYGYAIGVVEVDVPNNYLFITGVNGNYDNLANVTYEANAIFLDGTMKTITIDSKKSDFGTPSVLSGDEDDATINAWFTYTVNSKDVYAIDLVEKNAGLNKLGQSTEDRTGVIDYKNDSTYDHNGSTGNKVYGTDETVYLTASIDMITTGTTVTGNRVDVVIDGVDSVATGIDNVDIDPWSATEVASKGYATANGGLTSHGIYTLYDKDGYIIAMVAVGDDNGKSDGLVYVHSDSVSQESYDKTTEEYTWTRTAIQNGEEVTLTYVDDTRINLLNKMDENKWYRVRFNAEGEVIDVFSDNVNNTPDGIDEDLDFADWGLTTVPYAYVTNHTGGAINTAINTTGVDTVLYHQAFVNDVLSNNGKTLYLTQSHDSYIRFTDDTKVVFEQMNNNEWDTNYWTGEAGVKRAIKDLRLVDDTRYGYTVSAVIEDGRATTIIIRDNTPDGDSGTRPDVDNAAVVTNTGAKAGYIGSEIYGGGKTLTAYEMMSVLADQIEKDGYEVTKVTSSAVEFIGYNGRATEVKASDVYQVYKVTAKMDNTFVDDNWNKATVTVVDALDGDSYIRTGMQTVNFKIAYADATYDMTSWGTNNFSTSTTVGSNTPIVDNTSFTGVAGTNTVTGSRAAATTDDVVYVFSQGW